MMAADNEFETRSMLSASTILILSGFLIGLTVGNIVAEELSPYVLACGLSGFLAYIALENAAYRRKVDSIAQEQRQAENRLDRHVMSLSSMGFRLPPSESSRAPSNSQTAELELTDTHV